MHNLSYISDEDRNRLLYLNEKIRMCETIEEQRAVREEIASIESRRKPLNECSIEECTELRTAVWEKFDRLNRAGKYNIAQQFKAMLRQIEVQQQLIHRKAAEEEAERKLTEAKAKAAKLAEASEKDETEGNDKTQSQSISSRWTTGIGNLD